MLKMLSLVTGKGNSDMDEEDILRNGNQLLKMPTLVVRHNEQTITTTQHRLNHESSLLMKPRLELEQTQWGASKIQPRLDSSDFLSKTNFANSLNLSSKLVNPSFGSKLTPPSGTFGSPSHSGSFSSGMLNGNGSTSMPGSELKPAAFMSPPQSSPNLLANTSSMFNSKPGLLTNPTIGGFSTSSNAFPSKPVGSGFMANGPLNGTVPVFKAPLFQSNTGTSMFGQTSGFGSKTQSSLFGSAPTSSFGNKASSFGSKPSTFGSKPSTFGNKPSTFGNKPSSFGVNKFGMSAPLSSMVSAGSFQPMPSRSRNGELNHEPVFGSREKVRNTVATKEEKEKPSTAFEQYAGSSGATSSNPFAEAMRKAKNPSPRRLDSDDVFDESSSSYYTESETGESEDVSGFTDEDEDVSLGEESVAAHPVISDDTVSIPGEVGSTPLQPWPSSLKSPIKSPLKSPKPIMSPAKSLASPKFSQVDEKWSSSWYEASSEPVQSTNTSPARSRKPSKANTPSVPSTPSAPGSPTASLQPISPPTITRSKKDKKLKEITESPAVHRSPRRGRRRSSTKSIISPEHIPSKTPVHASPAQQPNGDIGTLDRPSPTEVCGHIDLDMPSLSLSIPKVLLDQATGEKKKSKARTRPRRASARTPNPYAATPIYPAATPAYEFQTPAHPPATPNYAPQTPAYFAPQTPAYSSNTPSATPQYHTQGSILPPPTPTHIPPPATPAPAPAPPAPLAPSAPNRYNPRIHAPTKEQMMAKFNKKIKKPKKARIGPKSFLQKRGVKVRSDSEDDAFDEKTMFHRSELVPFLSGRTDRFAPYRSRFKQNQKFLCYLRRRACDLILCLFPDLRFGGSFTADSDDVDGLIDKIIVCLENQDSSSRCMRSMTSSRKELEVRLCRAEKPAVRQLQQKLCKLLRLMLPSLSLQMVEDKGIKTLPALIHHVITENIT